MLFLAEGHFNRNTLKICGAFLVLILINAAINLFRLDVVEFVKTFFFFTIFFLVISLTAESASKLIGNKILLLSISVVSIIGFEIFQIIKMLLFKDYSVLFMLDRFSISTADNYDRFQAVNFLLYTRPISFYHEPSYMATVLFVLNLSNDYRIKNKFISVLCAIGIFLSLAMSVIVIFILYYMIKRKYAGLLFLFVGLSLGFFLPVLEFFRFGEIFVPGTSAWVRLILPLTTIIKLVLGGYYYLGVPLGNLPVILDNSLFLSLAYFGLWIIPFLYFMLNSVKIINKMLYFGIFMLLLVNGAFFTPESIFLFLLLRVYTNQRSYA